MKKIVLSLAGVMAAVAFAPEASAVPAFARQTGMACSACHYQHFPVINGFGRAFKEGGYTMMGAQEKIEGEGLSIPANLNLAIVGYMSDSKTNGPAAATPTTKTSNNNSLQIPQQVSLFAGGRVAENIGFEAEVNLANAGTVPGTQQAGLIRLKVPFVFDVAGVKAGLVPFSTGLGVADSIEPLNTGAVAVHLFNQSDMKAISAQQYIGTNSPANGAALIASNDNFFANVAKWGASNGVGASGAPSSNYLRGAYLTSAIPGFDSAIGFQSWSGTSAVDVTNAAAFAAAAATNGVVNTKAYAIDAQMLGDVSGMPLTLIASYANAPATTVGNTNLFNAGGLTRSSFNVGAELGVIPNVATVQLGLRHANSGTLDPVSGANLTDNAFMVGATYALALNVRAELTYSKYSGGMYSATSAAMAAGLGNQLIMMDLAFGF
jgi:hypothetical protein